MNSPTVSRCNENPKLSTGQRLVEVSAWRTRADYCRFLQHLAAAYPQAEKIVLVQDNLNTDAVFYLTTSCR